MDMENHNEFYRVALVATETIEIKVNGIVVYSRAIPAGMNAKIEFSNNEYKVEA